MELLAELFLLLTSKKRIGNNSEFQNYLPSVYDLRCWAECAELIYFPKAKLNLKLFAFLGSSRLETRHETHRKHCQELWNSLAQRINAEEEEQREETLALLSNLFLGFWGTGGQRTWCAQSFLPFCQGVLSGELIWNETAARREPELLEWNDVLNKFSKLFTQNQHRFLARGGELLYLQLCNALRQDAETVQVWLRESGREQYLTTDELNPEILHENLQKAFQKFFARTPGELNNLADFIDRKVEPETAKTTDEDGIGAREATCGWCPEESWREGYLFAVELLRLLNANIDIMETVELLQIACAMQLMRSLAAQSYRHSPNFSSSADGLNYRLFFSEPDGINRKRKELSKTTLTDVCREIYDTIRIPEIRDSVALSDRDRVYKDADNRYGYKLYCRVGKSIGVIVPRRGAGARFVLTDKLLRFFVLSLMPVKRMTLDTFKQHIEFHFGFVFDEIRLKDSPNWQEKQAQLDFNVTHTLFLEQMLEASGALVKLSDSCSLVKNPFCEEA